MVLSSSRSESKTWLFRRIGHKGLWSSDRVKIPRQSLRKVIVLLNFTSTYTVFKLLLQLKLVVWHALLFLKPNGMEVLLPISKPALTVACKIIAQTDPNSTESIVAGLLCSYLLLQVSSD